MEQDYIYYEKNLKTSSLIPPQDLRFKIIQSFEILDSNKKFTINQNFSDLLSINSNENDLKNTKLSLNLY